jgi:hypothetical protein
MFSTVLFQATLPAYLNNETGIKLALLDTLRRISKPFIDKKDDDGITTCLSRDKNDLLHLSISITNTRLDVLNVCIAICPVIEGISLPDTLTIRTHYGYREGMNNQNNWQVLPTNTYARGQ